MDEFFANRSRDATILFSNAKATLSFKRAIYTTLGFGCFHTCFFLYWTFRVSRAWRRSQDRRGKRILRELLGQIVAALLCVVYAASLILGHFRWQTCSYYGSIGAVLYVLSNCFCYRLLVSRAMIVVDVMPVWYRRLLKCMQWSIWGCVPMAILCFLAFSGKLLFKEGVCIEELNSSLPLFQAAINTIFSIGLLSLFLAPVLQQSRLMNAARKSNGIHSSLKSRRLSQVVKRNLLFSSVSIASSFIVLLACSLTTEKTLQWNLDKQHYNLIHFYAGGIDLLINTTMNIFMYYRVVNPDSKKPLASVKPSDGKRPLVLQICKSNKTESSTT